MRAGIGLLLQPLRQLGLPPATGQQPQQEPTFARAKPASHVQAAGLQVDLAADESVGSPGCRTTAGAGGDNHWHAVCDVLQSLGPGFGDMTCAKAGNHQP